MVALVNNSYKTTAPRDFSQYSILSEGRYALSSVLIQSSSNPDVIVNAFSDWQLGHTWRDGNCISIRRSTDRGRTWGAKTVIYNPASLGVVDCGGGIDHETGRMYVYTDVHDGSGTTLGSTHYLMLLYSDDDGLNWIAEDQSALIPSTESLRCYGTLIKNDGVLMFPFYTIDAEGDLNPNARYVARKTSGGEWTSVLVESTTTIYRNESDLIALSPTVPLMVTRDESTLEFTQYMSFDNGINWTNQGALSFGESWSQAAPPRLAMFQENGVDIVVCYITDRPNRKIMAVYGLKDDIINNGISGWNLSTKTTLYTPGNPSLYHYGGVCHYENDFRAIGAYSFDNTGWTSTSTNKLHVFDLPVTHKATVLTALGI